MNISTTYLTTPKLILRGRRACHPVITAVQWVLPLWFLVLGALTLDLLPIIIAVGYWAFTTITLRRGLKPHSVPGHSATITITDDEYRDECSVATGIRPWAQFKRVKRVREFWVLRFTGSSPMFLPRAALNDAQAAELEDFLSTKGEMKPGDLRPVDLG